MCYLHVYIAIYVALNIYVQMMILASYFESVTDDLKVTSAVAMLGQTKTAVQKQNIIKNRLLFGIKHHMAMKRYDGNKDDI